MSEQVNTVGQGAHFPFSSPEEESSLSPLPQSQIDVTDVIDERQRENNKEKASKNKNSAL